MYEYVVFYFNDTATTEIYTLSLHDALPILAGGEGAVAEAGEEWLRIASFGAPLLLVSQAGNGWLRGVQELRRPMQYVLRSEEHTSELQSRQYLVCRLLLEKQKIDHVNATST